MKKFIYVLLASLLVCFQIKARTQGWSELGGENSLGANRNINSICSDSSGNIYACGAFYNDSGKQYVAKYAGAMWSELGGLNGLAANGAIESICSDVSGNIYATGVFTNDSGNSYVAKYNGTSWSELGGPNSLAANASIFTVYCDKAGNIYAAGGFSNTSGKYYVAKYNGTSWSELGGTNALSANGYINSVISDASGNFYAAGYFINSMQKHFVAKYNGTTWSELGGLNALAANSTIFTLARDTSGDIYAAGTFNNDSGKQYVARYDGTAWSELGGTDSLTANSAIFCLYSPATEAGNIYAGGSFTNGPTNASGHEYVAQYNNTSWSELGGFNSLAANGIIGAICSDRSGNIYTAGAFTNPLGKYYVAKYNPLTGINEITPTATINLFPNPTNNTVTISIGNIITNASIKVYNITEQVLIEKNNLSGEKFVVDLSSQLPGIYFIEVREAENVWLGKAVKTD